MASVHRLFVVVAVLIAAGTVSGTARSITLPAGFTDELVVGLGGPTAFAFTPDGRMLVTTQGGTLRVVNGAGALLPTAALNLSARICANSERGLLGVAVDPAFSANRFIYLYYTWKKFGVCESNTANAPVNRVSRFVLPDSSVVDPATELVLVDNMPSPNGNHNAGDVQFGPDRLLYISVGDGGCDYAGGGCAGGNDAARDQHVLTGKILRVTRDGAIPTGNPFQGATSSRCSSTGRTTPGRTCQETFAWGLRNPFRIAFDPNTTTPRLHINDVGQNLWEEIDLGQAGADYGWNIREGHCANGSSTNCGPPPTGMTNPIYDYDRSSGCGSITGGAFVPNGLWPSAYDGKYLFADYVCGSIFRLDPSAGGGYTRTAFATGLGGGSAVHLGFGPRGQGRALYYTTYAGGGQVRRIYYSANGVPTAALTASPTSGPSPLRVTFDASGSFDPEGDPLTYLWAFGDGRTATTGAARIDHTYSSVARYRATMRARDSRGALSALVEVWISVGNTAPSPTIVAPASGSTFSVGQTITLTGTATDPQDGTLGPGALSWEVLVHHNDHTHPWFAGPGNDLTFPAPAPEDRAATTTSYLEVRLTATDSGGVAGTVSRVVQPRLVPVTLATDPSGLAVQVNLESVRGPTTITSWQGWRLNLFAPSPQAIYRFASWSDGGAQGHTVSTPAQAATYTARFQR